MFKTSRLVKSVCVSLITFFLLVATMWWWSWSPKAHTYKRLDELKSIMLPGRFRNSAEHDSALAAVGNPYVLEITTRTGALFYYGARHSTDPNDPQFADITTRWQAFRPTITLCEGRARGYIVRFPLRLLSGVSEPAMVHRLARSDNMPLYSLEPEYEEEVSQFLKTFRPEQVALYFTMRVYWSEAKGKPNDRLALHLLRKRTSVSGLRGALNNVNDIDILWRKELSQQPDWRGMAREPSGTFLSEISDSSVRVRGEYMARTLIDLVRRGERVFAVVGSGHVIRHELTLREALNASKN